MISCFYPLFPAACSLIPHSAFFIPKLIISGKNPKICSKNIV